MNNSCGLKIGAMLGVMEEVDVDDDRIGWGSSLRIKVCMDLTKLVAQARKINIRDQLHWITVKYEKLPRVRFQCG